MQNLLNLTIEERVGLLETQVVEIEEDITNLDENVDFLFDETVIQDERLLNLEEETSVINEEVEGLWGALMFQIYWYPRNNSAVQSSTQIVKSIHTMQDNIPVGCVLLACQPHMFWYTQLDVSTGVVGVGPQVNKFAPVSSDDHQMLVAGGCQVWGSLVQEEG